MGMFLNLFTVLGLLFCAKGIPSENLYTKSKTIYQLISETNSLRQVSTMINDSGLSLFFEQNHITAFIPTTRALLTFDYRKYGYDLTDRDTVRSLLLYHLVAGEYMDSDLLSAKEGTSLHPSRFKVYFNQFTEGNEKIYTVNGAAIITSNITASNGILHIIDRVMAPVTSPKTLHDYVLHPEIPNYSFSSINNASIVDLDLKLGTNDSQKKFTVFLPNDAHLVNMSAYGQNKLFSDWYLIRKVYHAHTVKDAIAFIPSRGDIPSLTSMQGEITFHRKNGKVYVKNNRVKAMILQPNIPTTNGVIHIIDNLLYFIYKNMVQTLHSIPNAKTFTLYVERLSTDTKSYLENVSEKKTVFVPTDTAFAKLSSVKQRDFNSDMDLLLQTLNNHIVSTELNETSLVNGMTLTTISNTTITVIKDADEIFLEVDKMRVTFAETDIGCSNGVIHLINNVIMKKDYTIWNALNGNITQLGKIKNIIKKFSDLSTLLDNAGIHFTVFLPMDYVIDDIPGSIISNFNNNPDVLYNAVSGHIILGHTLTKSAIKNGERFVAYGGHQLTTTTIGKGVSVTGSYISANVEISDIICSNGVIHIIDNLMHVPTRNVLDEMKQHDEIGIISSLVRYYTMTKLQSLLSDENKDITMFVPTNEAYYAIPKSRAIKMLTDNLLLERVLQAHIVTGSHLVEQMYSNQQLVSIEDKIYIGKFNNTVSLISNNVHSKITRSNIRATNGVIHMVDSLLYYPYFIVAETMSEDERLLPFFNMMFQDLKFEKMSEDEDSDMTVFVPSPASLQNITADSSILTKLFLGHVLPGVKLDQKFLRRHNSQNHIQQSENNVTFSLVNQTIGYSIDVGYSNLRYYFNIITDGIACSNGIVYMIDGLLNYNDKTLYEEVQQDSRLLHSLNYMLRFWPADSESKIRSNNSDITLFLPDTSLLDGLSQLALDFLDNLTNPEKTKFFTRHVMIGELLTKQDIARQQNMKNNAEVIFVDDEMFLKWNNTLARIIQPNILASNGIIHIIDKLFIDLPEEPTTASPSGTTKKKASQINIAVTNYTFNPLTLLLTVCILFLT